MLPLLIAALLALPVVRQPTALRLHCPFADGLVCSTGETLPFTRSTTSTGCPNPDEATSYTIKAVDTPCFVPGYGVMISTPQTNSITYGEAFGNAAWVALGTPTVATGAGDAPLNGADSDTIADSIEDTSAVEQQGVSQQYSASTTGRQVGSIWIRVASGTLAASICVLSGTNTCNTGNGCCSNKTATTAWQRVFQNTTVGATAQTAKLRIVVGNDGDAATTGVLIVHGAQAIAAAVESSGGQPYCPSTGASATTCGADVITGGADTPPPVAGGAISVTLKTYTTWAGLPQLNAATRRILSVYPVASGINLQSRWAVYTFGPTFQHRAFDASTNAITVSAVGSSASDVVTLATGEGVRTMLVNGAVGFREADASAPTVNADTLLIGNSANTGTTTFVSELLVWRGVPGSLR